MKRWVPFVLVCCLVGSAAPAAAQFTAAVVPPPPPPASPANPVVAHADTVKRAQNAAAAKTLTGMKAWVDSAAMALAQQPAAPADTAAAPAAAAPASGRQRAAGKPDTSAAQVNVATGEVGRFRNGAPAPATATPLPLIALLGVASVVAGALLRRRQS